MYDGLEGICMDGVCGENPCAGVVCDDGDPCTEGRCDYADGTCYFAPVVCDDREECTEDTCDPTDGCVFTAVEDGTECDGPHGMCQAGSCVWWPYTQDFESLDRMSPTALSDDGWSIYGQVLDASGTVKFGYGPFPAPNDTADPSTTFFSAIVTGEGGPEQGAQQLLVFNHYDCCGNEGHFNGTDKVRSSVFQQKSISADQVGKILEFSFDAKRGDINDPTGNSTALAFVQTFDLDAGYAQTNFMTVDTTNVGATWKRYSTSLEIDAGLVGQLLEFGFASVASNFEPSSVFYDNILVVLETRPD